MKGPFTIDAGDFIGSSDAVNDYNSGTNFHNFELFDLSGMKYTDVNGDSVIGAGDTTLAGVTVFIDANGNGSLDGGELSDITDGTGAWSFDDLGPGYAGKKVLEVLPNGYVQTVGTAGYTITGTSGTDQTGLNFANFDKFSISGFKYTDVNGDSVIGAGDTTLAGVTVFIDANGNGSLDGGELSDITDGTGAWSFDDLGPGYAGKKVLEVLPNGYVQTVGTAGYTITGTSGSDQTGLNFANFDKFSISGFKYTDVNGDSVIGAGDTTLAGVTVFIDANGNGSLDGGELSDITDGTGAWSFDDLGPGYAGKKVLEVLPNGYVQTLGTAGYTITGTSGN